QDASLGHTGGRRAELHARAGARQVAGAVGRGEKYFITMSSTEAKRHQAIGKLAGVNDQECALKKDGVRGNLIFLEHTLIVTQPPAADVDGGPANVLQ